MNRFILILPLLLAACNSSPTVRAENASVAEVAQKARDAIRIEPGQWTGKVELSGLKLPNLDRLPPEARAKMQTAMQNAGQHSFTNCVTAEALADPKQALFRADAGENCVYDRFLMQDGKIESEMMCQRGAIKQHTRMTGTFTSTSYDVIGETAMIGGGAGGGSRIHITATRTGACTGKENG